MTRSNSILFPLLCEPSCPIPLKSQTFFLVFTPGSSFVLVFTSLFSFLQGIIPSTHNVSPFLGISSVAHVFLAYGLVNMDLFSSFNISSSSSFQAVIYTFPHSVSCVSFGHVAKGTDSQTPSEKICFWCPCNDETH